MGSWLLCINGEGRLPFYLSLLLLITSQIPLKAEGRATTLGVLQRAAKKGEGDEKIMVRASIGSRPPRCVGMCMSCGRCEAVQVPVAPFHNKGEMQHFPTGLYFRGDEESSNYKPLSWKCKCGNAIFNP